MTADDFIAATPPREWEVSVWPERQGYVTGTLDGADRKRLIALVLEHIKPTHAASATILRLTAERDELAARLTAVEAELQQQRHRTAEFQTIAAGFANRAVAAEDRLAAEKARFNRIRAAAVANLADEARAVVQRRYYDEGQGYYVIAPDDAFVAGARWAVEIPGDTDASRYEGSPGEAADRAALAAPTDTTKEQA